MVAARCNQNSVESEILVLKGLNSVIQLYSSRYNGGVVVTNSRLVDQSGKGQITDPESPSTRETFRDSEG